MIELFTVIQKDLPDGTMFLTKDSFNEEYLYAHKIVNGVVYEWRRKEYGKNVTPCEWIESAWSTTKEQLQDLFTRGEIMVSSKFIKGGVFVYD